MAAQNLRVLAIDDQEDILEVLRAILENAGHHLSAACTGRMGLILAEQQRPDVILLDLLMPEMDGFQLLHILRQSPQTAGVPVILLTASRDRTVLEQGFQLGADDFLAKPFNAVELLARIRHLARFKRASEEIQYLQELNRLKEDFVAVLSHELRTPLTAIMGFTELLMSGLAGSLSPDQLQHLGIVMQRTCDLHQLIEELLEFNLIKAGQRRLLLRTIPVQALVREVANDFHLALEQNELTLDLRLPEHDIPVEADHGALRRVLAALLDNGIKFTPAGGTVTLEVDSSPTQVTIRVRDTGIGIPCECLPAIFDCFRQMEPHATRRYGGLGLGLCIAKYLMELHGGRIWVESQVGQGSTFTVMVPLSRPREGNHQVKGNILFSQTGSGFPATEILSGAQDDRAKPE